MNDCRYCSKPLTGRRPQTKYCGKQCRQRWHERQFRRLFGMARSTFKLKTTIGA